MGSVHIKMLLIPILTTFSLVKGSEDVCLNVLQEHERLSSSYPKRIAHGIHSLTLTDLHYYFNPLANETNNIPTVNMNLTSRTPILNDAPDLKRSDRFSTLALQVAESVVLNNRDDWDIHNVDLLDKLLHALHMHEMWDAASKIYKSLLTEPPFGSDVCSCLIDVENNGIYYNLRKIAMLIREPELGYNTENKRVPRKGRARQGYEGSYSTGTGYRGQATLSKSLLQKREAGDENENQGKHDKKYWNNLFQGFDDDMEKTYSDLAMFLYCILN